MLTGQWEVGLVVVEGDVIPFGWLMASRAIGAEFSAVAVIFFVAGITVGGCAFVNIIDMALLTLYINV